MTRVHCIISCIASTQLFDLVIALSIYYGFVMLGILTVVRCGRLTISIDHWVTPG